MIKKYLTLEGLARFKQKLSDELNSNLQINTEKRKWVTNASGTNSSVQINNYTKGQVYKLLLRYKSTQKYFVYEFSGDTNHDISHYFIDGNGNITYVWIEILMSGYIHVVQQWNSEHEWLSEPYFMVVYSNAAN